MNNSARMSIVLACAGLFGAATAAEPESMEIVIVGGPNAGKYTLPSANIYCMHIKSRSTVAASYKDFDASGLKTVGTAAIGVTNADDPGPKRGSVQVGFGGANDKTGVHYSLSIPAESPGPITMTRKGNSADLAFQGKTKDGISIRITARCPQLEEL